MTPHSDRHRTSRVLAIDDDPDILRLIEHMLEAKDVSLSCFADVDEALAGAARILPDLILLDYHMPRTNGLEVLSAIRADPELAHTPVVFVTGSDDHKVLTACFEAGAADYISKPFCSAELRARVQSVIDRTRMLQQLEHMALIDSLTDLPNRETIRRRIEAAIDRVPQEHYALMFVDLDRFKIVNDTYGHEVGDQLLRQVARELLAVVRDYDAVSQRSEVASTPARMGGDEFVLLLENLRDPADAQTVAQRVIDRLTSCMNIAGHELTVGASVGVVTSKLAYRSADDVLRDADTAMYHAKSSGKGRFVVFDPHMRVRAQSRVDIENRLQRAVRRGEFFLTYQPIHALDSQKIRSVEALLRWRDPERGIILPDEFIRVAEEAGLIVAIGDWVIEETCRQIARWQRAGGAAGELSVHVNISRRQLAVSDFVQTVAAALSRHGVSPGSLELEVTETELMQDLAQCRDMLNQLRDMGIRIHIDDFGSEYSSLACLQSLPVDTLKIDRSFILNLGGQREIAGLLQAITVLASNLGFEVIAEGVETAEQLAMLQSLECGYGQGYLFSEPLMGDEIAAFLDKADRRHEAA